MNVNENNPILDAIAIRESVKKTTDATLKTIMEQQIKEEMKRIIKEADSDYEEEEVGLDTQNVEMPEVESEEGVDVDSEEIILDDEMPEDEEGLEGMEDFEVADDTYDVSQDDEAAIKIFKNMSNSDQIVITKQGDNTIEISDDETGADYIIDLNEDEFDDETLGESTISTLKQDLKLNPTNQYANGILGKGGRKEKLDTPIGISPNRIGGFGAGTGGRKEATWKTPGDGVGEGTPFKDGIEGLIDEAIEEVVDEGSARTNSNLRRISKKPQTIGKNTNRVVRNGAQKETAVTEDRELVAQMKKIVEENLILKETVKQLRECAQNFYVATQETVLTNQKLGKAIQLFSEHSTTLDEKKNIIERFEGFKTQEQIQALYETISKELKSRKPIIENLDNSFNNIVTEIKLTQQPFIVNEEVKKIQSLMERVCK